MSDECSINFYNVKEGNFIYLENLMQQKDSSESEVRLTLSSNLSRYIANQGKRLETERTKQ